MPTKSARRKLLFHIGHHKTGSTTIQNAFATGRVKLVGGRVLYPGRMTHNYLPRHFDSYILQQKVLPGTSDFPSLAAISTQLQKGDFDVAVISGEEFEGADPSNVQAVLSKFMLPFVDELAVICYVRPHAARVLSSFAERVKIGHRGGTPEDFHNHTVRDGRFLFSERLSRWDVVFKEQLRIRPMIRAELAEGSVFRDFVVIGFGHDARVESDAPAQANESLCLEDLVLVKLVQDSLKTRGHHIRHAMGWKLASRFGATARDGKPGTKLMLHKALAERIRMAYRADAEALDTRFFGGRNLMRDELDRAVDEALPVAQSFEPTDHFSADTLRVLSVLGAELNQLFDHEAGPWSDFLMKLRIAALHAET